MNSRRKPDAVSSGYCTELLDREMSAFGWFTSLDHNSYLRREELEWLGRLELRRQQRS
jgi:hypothetical protein